MSIAANLIFAGVFAVVFLVLYFAWMRPWLARYQRTAGVMAAIHKREASGFGWLMLRLKGARTSIGLFFGSFLAGVWGLLKALVGVDPAALQPFQDSTLWKSILADELAIKAAAVTMFVSAVLVFKGKVHDIATVPQATPVVVPPGGSATPGAGPR